MLTASATSLGNEESNAFNWFEWAVQTDTACGGRPVSFCITQCCHAPGWGDFRQAMRQSGNDWAHPALANAALALQQELLALPDDALWTLRSFSRQYILFYVLPPRSLDENISFDHRFVIFDCIVGLFAIDLVLAFREARNMGLDESVSAAIESGGGRGQAAYVGDIDPNSSPTARILSSASEKGLAAPLVLSEHSSWGIAFTDVLALAGPRFEWPIGAVAPGAKGFHAFCHIGRLEGWLPQPSVLGTLKASWPLERFSHCRPGVGAAPPPDLPSAESRLQRFQSSGLHVAIFLLHHGEFQQARALLSKISEEYWGGTLISEAYGLMLRSRSASDTASQSGQPDESSDRLEQHVTTARIRASFVGHDVPQVRVSYGDFMAVESLTEAELWADALANNDQFLRNADAIVGCSPLWVCVVLHRVLPDVPIISLLNMALLDRFNFWSDLTSFWRFLASFLSSPRVALGASHRLMAEQVFAQTGTRPEYVPLVGLHVLARFSPQQTVFAPTLVWTCAHPAMHFLRSLLEAVSSPSGNVEDREAGPISPLVASFLGVHAAPKFIFHDYLIDARAGEGIPYSEVASYRGVVLVPHVPNPVSLSDLYAMHMPIFLPSEPYIYRFLWDHSDTFAGPGGSPLKRERMPPELRQDMSEPPHPHDPLEFLVTREQIGRLHIQAYWHQYTEFAELPGLLRFGSIADLTSKIDDLSLEKAKQVSSQMRVAAAWRASAAARWFACTLRAAQSNNISS